MLAGLTSDTTREHIARAAFEGVLFGLKAGHDAINAAGARTTGPVTVVGGGARSEAYRQLLADVVQQPVVTRRVTEATARGACIQAASVLHGSAVVVVRDAWAPPIASTTPPVSPVPAETYQRYLRLVGSPVLTR